MERTAEDAVELFKSLEDRFPSKTVGGDRWYLIAVTTLFDQLGSTVHSSDTLCKLAALTGGAKPEFAANLYNYLIQEPQYSSSEQRQALTRRLREVLVKCVSIVGVCRPLEAVFSIDKVQRPEDKDYSFSR